MNQEEYGMSGNTVYSKDDGKVVDLEQIKKLKEDKIVADAHRALQELSDLGLTSNLVIFSRKNKDYQCVEIKKNFEFNKEFRVELRDIMTNNLLSRNARCVIGTLTPFISFPSNAIHIDYKNPSIDDLTQVLDMSKSALMRTFKELEKHNIIKRVRRDGYTSIYFNCFLFIGGKCVEKSTYDLFKDSLYNPTN